MKARKIQRVFQDFKEEMCPRVKTFHPLLLPALDEKLCHSLILSQSHPESRNRIKYKVTSHTACAMELIRQSHLHIFQQTDLNKKAWAPEASELHFPELMELTLSWTLEWCDLATQLEPSHFKCKDCSLPASWLLARIHWAAAALILFLVAGRLPGYCSYNSLETMDLEAYFERIGYIDSRRKLDLETLTDVFQHHIRAVPYENLNIHCEETMELDLQSIFDQIVRRKRGGWCLQVNQLLYWALTTMGFETVILGGYVYNPPEDRYSNNMIHLVVQVTIDSRNYIVDAGFGRSYQIWQPLELISGKDQPQIPSIFRLSEEGGTWYLDQIRRERYIPNKEFLDSDLLDKNKYQKLYSFTLQPRTIEEFESASTFLQTSPVSVFTGKSFCSLQTQEGVHCLVGFTLTSRRFNYKDNVDLVEFKTLNEDEVKEVLKDLFNITLQKKFVPKYGDQFFTFRGRIKK